MSLRTKTFVIVGILLLLIFRKAFMFDSTGGQSSNDTNNVIYSPTPITLTLADSTTSEKETTYIKQTLNEAHAPAYYTTCVRYVVGEAKTYYQIEIHELHNGNNCPGATGVSPLAAMFRINKADNNITYYDVVNDKFIPFKTWVANMQKQQ